ncbi:MAG TPA: polysaccharide biosynthesis tyrosine autokinase [Solirubrobacteraceae bacterium]
MQQDSQATNTQQFLGVLIRRTPLILLCVVIVAGVAFGLSKRQAKEYTATASLVFRDNSLSQQIAGLSSGGSSSSTLLAEEANDLELVKGGDLASKTAALLGHGLTEEKVRDGLSVAGRSESGIVEISSTSRSPTLAAEIANTYSHLFVAGQQSANSHYFKSALALVHKQLSRLSPQQRVGPDGLQLQDRAQTLSLLSELSYNDVQVGQEPLAPTSPSSPKTSKNTALGAVLGFLIGIGIALALGRFDRRIKSPEELEAIYGLPLLGAVPQSTAISRAARDNTGKYALPPADAEAFSLIRAHMRFLNVDTRLRTVMIASAAPGDGKTTIARHLAEAAARSGSRVLLLEVDLRHPTLAGQLDVQTTSGLSDVLTGSAPLGTAIRSVSLESIPAEGAADRFVDVLVAGPLLPPNPGELIESRAMDAVLEQVKPTYDLIVIDTPPLAVVSDAFALLTKVDGVVIVGWIGRSRRDVAERLHQALDVAGAPLVGVIANGSKLGGSGKYAYTQRSPVSSVAVESHDGDVADEALVRAPKV